MTTVEIYLDSSVVYSYDVDNPMKGREHAAAIIATGYRHTGADTNDLEWFPPHRIVKVKVKDAGEQTAYKDRARST